MRERVEQRAGGERGPADGEPEEHRQRYEERDRHAARHRVASSSCSDRPGAG